MSNILEYENIPIDEGIIPGLKSNSKSKIEDAITELEIKMKESASNLEFEDAAKYRDQIIKLEKKQLGLR